LFTAGRDTLIGDLVRLAGGRNVVGESGYVGYSVEQLLKDQPRVYLGTSASLTDRATIAQRPGYKRLQCVMSGRVIVLEDNLVSRPGPRIVEGLEQMARALHPDRF
jgi:iron complex transport system substrate-binding protein